MVARLLATLVGIGCSIFLSSLYAGQLPLSGKPHYYDTFDPALSPWQAPQERNIEEVFKRHEYFAIVYSDDGKQLAVTRHRKSQPGSVQHSGQVVDLDHGKPVADLSLSGMPHLGSGITWVQEGRTVFATPNLKDSKVTVMVMDNWKVINEIDTLEPGFFMRSHEKTPYAWTDVFFGPNRDAMHVIDKGSLEIVETLRPEPGKTSAHVEFTRDGRYALVSLWETDGALVVYDAAMLAEVKRIPMRKPSG